MKKIPTVEEASRIADKLRFRFGFNYEQTREFFERFHGTDDDTFEELMYECDRTDSIRSERR